MEPIDRLQSNIEHFSVATVSLDTTNDPGLDFDSGQVVARTTIKLDGDTEVTIPVAGGVQGRSRLEEEIFRMHSENVRLASDLRTRLIFWYVKRL